MSCDRHAPGPAPTPGGAGSPRPGPTVADLRVCRQSATVRGHVEEKLRLAIYAGRFSPGQRLTERELCQSLGVGRTSVREALRQLESEGLVTSVPHRGLTVSRIEGDAIDQIYALRALVEGYAARRCAESADARTRNLILAAAEAFEAAAGAPAQTEVVARKAAFYALLKEGSGNAFVAQVLTSLHARIDMLRTATLTEPGRLAASAREIKAIAVAIASRDGATAEEASRTHVDNAAAIARVKVAQIIID